MRTPTASVAVLGLLLLASAVPAQRWRDAPVAKLIAKSKTAFFHVTWNADGAQVLQTDRETGAVKTYTNPAATFASAADLMAF